MSEERQYGLEDGEADALAGKPAEHDPAGSGGGEYENGYRDGYRRGVSSRVEEDSS